MIGAERGVFINRAAKFRKTHAQNFVLQTGDGQIIVKSFDRFRDLIQKAGMILLLVRVVVKPTDGDHENARPEVALDEPRDDGHLLGEVAVGRVIRLIFACGIGFFDRIGIAKSRIGGLPDVFQLQFMGQITERGSLIKLPGLGNLVKFLRAAHRKGHRRRV